jgi:hypothetical protein
LWIESISRRALPEQCGADAAARAQAGLIGIQPRTIVQRQSIAKVRR